MLNKLKKFDFIFIVIALLGTYFLFEQVFFFKKPVTSQEKLSVTVAAPKAKPLTTESLQEVKEVYFANSTKTSRVKEITERDGFFLITIEGTGIKTADRVIFENRHLAINERVKLHGLVKFEGRVVEIKEDND